MIASQTRPAVIYYGPIDRESLGIRPVTRVMCPQRPFRSGVFRKDLELAAATQSFALVPHYCHEMDEPPVEPRHEEREDSSLARALAWLDTQPADSQRQEPEQPAAFYRYRRVLTENGGFRIEYTDQLGALWFDAVRVGVWLTATALTSRLFLFQSDLSFTNALLATAAAGAVFAVIVRWKILRTHSIEIRPDGIIADGRWFSVAAIGDDNWPRLQMKNDNENRLVLAGLVGTRYIEFATANRCGKHDRTPERLAEDLDIAMEQLWGRSEGYVPTPV